MLDHECEKVVPDHPDKRAGQSMMQSMITLGRINHVAVAALAAACIAMSATGVRAQAAPIPLGSGGRTVISLSENPSTGYVWNFDAQGSTNAGIVKVTDLGFARPQSATGAVGVPGLHRWSIEGIHAGRASLHFVYSRPWEGTPAQQQMIVIMVR